MKCEDCPALRVEGYEYPESYCAAGVPEDGKMATDSGCKYTLDRILKRIRHRDRQEAKQYDGVDEWYTEELKTEAAMRDAMQTVFAEHYGGLYLCFQNDRGEYYALCGDGKLTGDIAADVLMKFRDAEAALQKSYCERCKWQGKWQKCSCCRRKRDMKDNFVEDLE